MRKTTFLLTLATLFLLSTATATAETIAQTSAETIAQTSAETTPRTTIPKEDRHPELFVHLGISGSPAVAAEYFNSGKTYVYSTLESIYRDRSGGVKTFGTIIAGLDIKFNRVVAVSIDLGFNALWSDKISGITGDKTGSYKSFAVYFVPKAKLYYMDRPVVRMYGSIGIGIGKYFGHTVSGSMFENPYTFELQFVPYGIEVGRKLFGFAELGFGTIYMGANAGIGYKF